MEQLYVSQIPPLMRVPDRKKGGGSRRGNDSVLPLRLGGTSVTQQRLRQIWGEAVWPHLAYLGTRGSTDFLPAMMQTEFLELTSITSSEEESEGR